MNRRGFLGVILATGCAPWIAKAGVLMPVRPLIFDDGGLFFDPAMKKYEQYMRGMPFIAGTILAKREGIYCPAGAGDLAVGVWDGERVVTSGEVSVRLSTMRQPFAPFRYTATGKEIRRAGHG